MNQTVSILRQSLPCRYHQIQHLHNLFAYDDEPKIENVYIYGGPSTGKSIVTRTVLETLKTKHVIVNLAECYTSKILFESILNRISGHRLDPENPLPFAACDNMMEFVDNLIKLDRTSSLNGYVIVLRNVEELRKMDYNLLHSFLNIKELSGISICVVMISELPFEKFYTKSGITEPIKIHFPQYNSNELLEILTRDINNARNVIIEHYNKPLEFDTDFYKNYLNLFLSVFYRVCRDLSELRYISRMNFIRYCEPVLKNENKIEDSMALWRHIAPILRSSLETLYLRIDTSKSDKPQPSLELPFYAKYLLISAYIASYNPAKDDRKLFMKTTTKQKKKLKDIRSNNKVSEKLNTQLGPKPFLFDRLLAIFYSILNDDDNKMGFNNNVLVQISSLIELKLLSSCSNVFSLDGQRFKCNVNFEFIQRISRSVGFDIKKYLSDFNQL